MKEKKEERKEKTVKGRSRGEGERDDEIERSGVEVRMI